MKTSSNVRMRDFLALLAVIALALMIVFPAASTARSSGKSTLCLANLHILGRAWLAYQDDNHGKLVNALVPRDASYANLSKWLSEGYKDNAWWVNPPHNQDGVFTGGLEPSLAEEDNGIRSGKLFPYVGTSAPYHCPSDLSYLKTINRGGKRSYDITAVMHGENPKSPDCADLYSQIVRPSVKLVFIEATDFRGWNMGSWMMTATNPPGWIDLFTIWHGYRTNLGFADGHASQRFWVDPSTRSMVELQQYGVHPGPGEGSDLAYMASIYLPKR
jgi:prepilin-type processing-associated H-X9-DG protein